MSSLLQIEQPERPRGPASGFALWHLGFRPFYLLASGFAALSIALWALQFAGALGHPYLHGSIWHAHEMLFGFALAVVVGFLFTAGRNWSNQPTPTGVPLALLALLWIAGRGLVLTPWGWAAAIVNAAFPLAAAIGLGMALFAARNRRNYFFVGLLLLMSAATFLFHLGQLGVLHFASAIALQVALDLLLFILVVMSGRVIPMFTNNGVPGVNATRRPALERLALFSVLLLPLADALQLPAAPLIALTAVGCGAHLVRWLLWQPWRTLRVPLVWVLHAAYLWVPVHLLMRALAQFGVGTASLATHALTVGAAGGMIIGMMTRTARGHTGRPLRASRSDLACYMLVLSAALVRVFLPWFVPAQTVNAVLGSAVLWSAGFGLYAVTYWTVLTRPRLDGKPG